MDWTVCIIDDDLVSQFATVYCIEQANKNCSILTCDSAQEGLDLLSTLFSEKKALPDILFLDLVMPGMDGWEFLDRIKHITDWREKMDIYILSAFANSSDRDRAKEHPLIQGYFDKPLSRGILEKIFLPKIH
ncbi:MAG: response regulator [Aurantibacter sp.]